MALTLTRTATVYSLSQLDLPSDGSEAGDQVVPGSKGFLSTPDKAVNELKGSLLPLYQFPDSDGFAVKRIRSFGDLNVSIVPEDMSRISSDDEASTGNEILSDTTSSSNQVVPQRSILDSLLLAEWEDRAEQGLFRYDVTACPTKLLPGAYGFVAQENEGRAHKKRMTEFRVDQVYQEFDETKFNFCKALQKEVLFQFQPAAHRRSPSFSPAADPATSPNIVIINVSPIEYGHVLLVPRVLDKLNQVVNPDTLSLALQFAREANNPYLRVGFNSLGAYGTINHLHFQAYYLAAPMAAERAPTVPLNATGIRKRGACRIFSLAHYPVRGLVFEVGDSVAELGAVVGAACERLTEANVPHNLLIVDSGARVFLFPNAFAEKKAKNEIPDDIVETMVDPACWEIGGHIVLKRHQDYVTASEEWAWKLLEYASLSEEAFDKVVRIALQEGA